MRKILIADDNVKLNKILQDYAKKEGFEVYAAFDGEETLKRFEIVKPDVILLDVMMPKMDGFEVCKRIRETSMVPIIMITARSDDYDKIMGLDMGADDYVVKPFSPSEVMARLRAIFRRMPDSLDEDRNICGLAINAKSRRVRYLQTEIDLTKKEFDLLDIFTKNKDRVYSRDQLLDLVWGWDYDGDSRTVDTHVKRLRSKLEKNQVKEFEIETIWGVGYKGVCHE
ncbi:MAG: response regulator transcription factor [Tissierellia bacterium]|nr:response regulator transcription factor [Tissierellia bacterium]